MEVGRHTQQRQPVQKSPAISRRLNFDPMTKYMAVYYTIIRSTYSCAGLKLKLVYSKEMYLESLQEESSQCKDIVIFFHSCCSPGLHVAGLYVSLQFCGLQKTVAVW